MLNIKVQYFHGLPYSELMRLTLISSPFEAFATSIFFDQLPHFNSTKSLENKQGGCLLKTKTLYLLEPGSVFFFYIMVSGLCPDLVAEV